MLKVRRLEASQPDPMTIGRSLARRRGLVTLRSGEPTRARGRFSFVTCEPDHEIEALDPYEGGPAADPGDPFAFVPRFIGIIPYEARRSALERPSWSRTETRRPSLVERVGWAMYPAVVVVDHELGEAHVVGESDGAVSDLDRLVRAEPVPLAPFELSVRDTEPEAAHIARVARAIELIRAGDLYQVNLARKLALELRGAGATTPSQATALACFAAMARAAPSELGAFIALASGSFVSSTSPELALDASPSANGRGFDVLVTEPIKGTRPRGHDDAADAALARELEADEKERAELAMIVDVERNDLARVSMRGSVEVAGQPRVVTHRTVHHRVATVRGRARPGVTRAEVLEAMIPSGSVTGAPKVRAMEVIADLESARRGLYTGAFGYAAHDGSFRLAMAIRTAVFGPDGSGEYGVGGGIVVDSDPVRELEETRWKSLQLRRIAL